MEAFLLCARVYREWIADTLNLSTKKHHYNKYFLKLACLNRNGESWCHVFIFRFMNLICDLVHKPGITESGPVWLCNYKPIIWKKKGLQGLSKSTLWRSFSVSVQLCPVLALHSLMKTSPSGCKTSQMNFNTTCSFSCLEGYRLQGPSYKYCRINGQWTDSAKSVSCNGGFAGFS